MVLRRRNLYLATGVFGVGYAASAAASTATKDDLTAEQLHGRQEQDLGFLKAQLGVIAKQRAELGTSSQMLSPDTQLTLYKLRSCPYCAVVSSLLDYGRIPYKEVSVDPLTSSGMPNSGYNLVPQLEFSYGSKYQAERKKRTEVKKEAPESGYFLVDSEAISTKFAPVLGLEQSLQDPKTKEARSWVKNTFVRTSFVAMNGTYGNAYASFPGLVPSSYHWMPIKVVGAGVLHVMAKYMTQPKLLKNNGELLPANCKDASSGEVKKELSAEQVLTKCCDHFAQDIIPQGCLYHGGQKPSLVDVELYGVLRSVSQQSAQVKHAIDESNLAPWVTRMKQLVPNQASKTY